MLYGVISSMSDSIHNICSILASKSPATASLIREIPTFSSFFQSKGEVMPYPVKRFRAGRLNKELLQERDISLSISVALWYSTWHWN